MSLSYPSNLTPDQWELLASLIPVAKPGDRLRSVDMQGVVNAIVYILCATCAGADVAIRLSLLENGLPLLPSLAQ